MVGTVKLLTADDEIARCFPVVHELRPHIESAEALLAMTRVILAEGGEIAALEHGGEIATFSLFRIRTMLVSGRTMYVDDLVTAVRFRSQGHGKVMLDWLQDHARKQGCDTFSLDSGTFRKDAHAFYFREGLRITSFHFERRF